MTLIDAGPLIALVHADDKNHVACRDALKTLRGPLGTVWPAVTEAMFLLAFSLRAQEALWEMLETAPITLLALGIEDAPRMRELMRKYQDLPMDLADAALVCVAERQKIRRVFTLDRRDFSVYRPSRLKRFTMLP